jgi:hypothetical protein
MAISIVLRRENGETLELSEVQIVGTSLASLRARFPMFRWIDPYGDAIYNVIQYTELAEEIRSGEPASADDRVVVNEVLRLCEIGLLKPHRYLWFIGD